MAPLPSEPFGRPLQRAILIDQGLQVDMLLLGGVQSVLFILQLRLQAAQDLQIAGQPVAGISPTCCPLNSRIFSSCSARVFRAVSNWFSRNFVVSSDCCWRTSRFSLMNRLVSSLVTCCAR